MLVYKVQALYDMNVDADEEIIIEIYATEELAQQRVRQLIDAYKKYFHTEDEVNFASVGQTWDEHEFRLYAYMDSEWNVDICYLPEEVRTTLKH